MIKNIAFLVGVMLLAGLLVIFTLAAGKPDEFRMERSTTIKAPPEKIFAVISDFHRSSEWSPWEKMDPNIKRTYSGPDVGKGSKYAWKGNSDVGEGTMEVLEYSPSTKLVTNLRFISPMEGDNLVEYVLEPSGDVTKITWSIHGPNTFVGKVAQVFINCEDMIRKQFDEGLANLKALCEK